MYLGYLAAGGNSVTQTDMRQGLDIVLNRIKNGDSLEDVVFAYTGKTLLQFERDFGTIGAAFVKNLITEVGDGTGGVATNSYNRSTDNRDPAVLADNANILPDTVLNMPLFQLDINHQWVSNRYPHDVYNGGTKTNGNGPKAEGLAIAANKRPVGNGAALHVGSDANMTNKIQVYIDPMDAESLGVDQVDVSTEDLATLSIERVALALARVSEQRSELGACQNRLEHTIDNLDNIVENTTAAESQIRDTDMAKEMVAYSNANILQQAGQAMLAQMNQSNQGVLSLIA
ncbi:MAG: hypothetical protein K2P39_14275 [Lachnospiraceae bacterium]|nr:hypothetical protein [Lachnospiraceae bacterium]